MKYFIVSILLIVVLQTGATDYYFSNSGSDANGNGSQAAPFESITMLNSLNLQPGDRLFFKRGDTFFGSINCKGSGNSGNNIVFSAYGKGAKPVITGFTTLPRTTSDNWTQISTSPNIWETSAPVNNGFSTELRVVTVNGKDMEMGRYPNHTSSWGGYLKYENHDGKSAIIDNELPTTPNWTGARIVLKYGSYLIDTATIMQHTAYGSSSRLSFDPAKIQGKANIPDNWGYIICNDPRTLDVHGEWYYNKSTRKLQVCLAPGTTPANYTIKVSTIAKTFTATDRSNIVIDGIRFEGANDYGIAFEGAKNGSSNTVVQNCDVQYCGMNGIHCGVNSEVDYNFLVQRNFIADCHDVSVYARNTRGVTVYGNTIKRNALLTTMGGVGTQARIGVWCARSNYTLRRNYIDSIGYVGTRWTASNVMIDSNYITNFTLVIDDGGGTYSGNGGSATNRKIMHNVIVNGLGNAEGTNRKDFRSYGIYLDNSSNNVEVAYNIVGNCKDGAFYLHNSKNVNVHHNLFYGAAIGQRQVVWIANDMDAEQYMISRLQFKHNVVIAKGKNEWVMKIFIRPSDPNYLKLIDEDIGATPGTNLENGIDSNIYARPLNQNSETVYAMCGTYVSGSEQKGYYTNAQWKTAFGHDVHTVNAPRRFAAANEDKVFQFHYNASAQDSTITIDRSLIDLNGSVHAAGHQYKLAPFSGVVFLDTKSALSPNNDNRDINNNWNVAGNVSKRIPRGNIVKNKNRIMARARSNAPQNLLMYSQELDNPAWRGGNAALAITANATAGPSGSTTAELVSEIEGVTGQKNKLQDLSVIKDSIYTLSIHFKDAGRRYVQLAMGLGGKAFTTTAFANFDLTDSTVSFQGSGILDARIAGAGSGWYRCSITAKAMATTASSSAQFSPVPAANARRLPSYTGETGKDFYWWGAQVNSGYLVPYSITTSEIIP